MKIFEVTFNDGGWHSGSLPHVYVVAESKDEAKEKALIQEPHFKNGYDVWAREFTIEGYVIEVYDEKTYNRLKNLEKLDI